MKIVFAIVIGLVIGGLITYFLFLRPVEGALRIDHSDPQDEPYLFLELSESVGKLMRRKWVVLRIKREDFIPQK